MAVTIKVTTYHSERHGQRRGGAVEIKRQVLYLRVPGDLVSELRCLAGEERRTLTQQVIWMLEDGVRRERAQRRRAEDPPGERGAA
jgi:hypothetical protein